VADRNKIEEAIEKRLIRALDEDLDSEGVEVLEHKIETIRQLAGD